MQHSLKTEYNMKNVVSLFIVFLTFNSLILSQSIIGGDLSFRNLTAYTYEFKLTIISVDTIVGGTNPDVVINYGDGTTDTIPRTATISLPNFIKRDIYITTHTYQGYGIYNINIIGSNWISNIQNINNSANEPFQISQTFNINSIIGNNNSVELSGAFYDTAKVGQLYIYNPSAYDSDGDSLSYSIVPCLPSNYVYPIASSSFGIDSISGDLAWNKPVEIGYYAIAIKIDEWRNTFKIGSTIRQMIINVSYPSSININENTENLINIFPNPANISFEITTENEQIIKEIVIYTIEGRMLIQQTFSESKFKIETSQLPIGMYLIKVETKEKRMFQKLIISH
ncbi:MAG: hypothetical protein COX07_02125 [Bacteroidetes bacterium CG23_combo_of_CG06-09_8_20_14_all_32_9]|nr:MAG: hypothetical protein COX07_02125 [Bacteroidetes bacterium CG23_combo_of_CG06-09_8_20_14_all_32_9]